MTTRTITDICGDIRNIANKAIFIQNIKRHGFNWDLTWAAMDTIEDTELAIDSFEEKSPKSSQGNEYLRVYGLFQAIYMQQDGVRNLAEGLSLPTPDISSDPKAKEVRETRNKYSGHHKYERKGVTTYHGISRITVGGETITAWTYPDFSTEVINFKTAIKANKKYIKKCLEDILAGMEDKKAKYIAKVKTTLSEDRQTYAFEKIYSWVFGSTSDRTIMTSGSLKAIRTAVDELEAGLNERYENLSGVGDAERTIQKTRYILDALDSLFEGNQTGMNGDFNAEVYVESLQNSFIELVELSIEINSEFYKGSNPTP